MSPAMSAAKKTLVIRNGTLIDGSGKPSARNDAIVVEGNRIKSVGALPGDVHLEDRKTVDVVDAAGKWVMPGLIDAHCHMSYGYPLIKGEGKGKGTTRPEFSTLKSARSAPTLLMRLPSTTMASLRDDGFPEPSMSVPLRTTSVFLAALIAGLMGPPAKLLRSCDYSAAQGGVMPQPAR